MTSACLPSEIFYTPEDITKHFAKHKVLTIEQGQTFVFSAEKSSLDKVISACKRALNDHSVLKKRSIDRFSSYLDHYVAIDKKILFRATGNLAHLQWKILDKKTIAFFHTSAQISLTLSKRHHIKTTIDSLTSFFFSYKQLSVDKDQKLIISIEEIRSHKIKKLIDQFRDNKERVYKICSLILGIIQEDLGSGKMEMHGNNPVINWKEKKIEYSLVEFPIHIVITGKNLKFIWEKDAK